MKVARKQFDKITGENYKADSGAVVVMEAKTGRVVAMASNPTYDPNAWVGGISAKDYAEAHRQEVQLPAAQPGHPGPGRRPARPSRSSRPPPRSTPATRFDGALPLHQLVLHRRPGLQELRGRELRHISLGRALEVSCDTVFYGLAYNEWQKDGGIKPKKHPKDWFYKTAHQFGLGKETGIDLPNEVTGRVPDRQWKQDYWKANKDAWCKTGQEERQLRRADRLRELPRRQRRCAPVTPSTTRSARATPSSPRSRWPRSTRPSPTAARCYEPTVGKAIISADGKHVKEIKPKVARQAARSARPDARQDIDKALAGVATRGTAAWRFGGWPQDKIPMHAKTGTAEVYGKQTTSWFATYTKDYTIVMTISQGGTGSGASGPAVRNIYNAMYGLDGSGKQDLQEGPAAQPADRAAEDPARTAPIEPQPTSQARTAPGARSDHAGTGRTAATRRRDAVRRDYRLARILRLPVRPRARRLAQAHRPRLRGAPARLAAARLRARAVLIGTLLVYSATRNRDRR